MSILKSLWGGSSQKEEDTEGGGKKADEQERGEGGRVEASDTSVGYWVKGLGGKYLFSQAISLASLGPTFIYIYTSISLCMYFSCMCVCIVCRSGIQCW